MNYNSHVQSISFVYVVYIYRNVKKEEKYEHYQLLFYCRFFGLVHVLTNKSTILLFPFSIISRSFFFPFFLSIRKREKEREKEHISFPSYSIPRSESSERRHHFDFEVQPVSLSKTFRGKLLNAIGIFLGGLFVVLVVLLSFVPTDCPQSSKLVA